MKKQVISLKTALKSTPSISIVAPAVAQGHHVSIINANSDDFTTALGVSADRAKELEQDIIAACKGALSTAMGARVTLLQTIAIATAHTQTDNELVYATALIAEAFARDEFQNLEDQMESRANGTTENTTDDGEPAGFAQFLASLGLNAGALAGGDNDEEDELDAE